MSFLIVSKQDIVPDVQSVDSSAQEYKDLVPSKERNV